MSKKSGLPDFNWHQSFTAAIGAQSKNLSSIKHQNPISTGFEMQIEAAEDDAILLSIPKGPLQGRKVVISQNGLPQSREKKMIQLRKDYEQSVKKFFDASPARRINEEMNKVSSTLEFSQIVKQKSSQQVNKSQQMRPQSAANKLSHSNVKAISSFLQNREMTLANQISLGHASTLYNEQRPNHANGSALMNNLFNYKSQHLTQQPQQVIHNASYQQFSNGTHFQKPHDADNQDRMMQQQDLGINNNFPFHDINQFHDQCRYNNIQSIGLTQSNSMLNLNNSSLLAMQQPMVSKTINNSYVQEDGRIQGTQIYSSQQNNDKNALQLIPNTQYIERNCSTLKFYSTKQTIDNLKISQQKQATREQNYQENQNIIQAASPSAYDYNSDFSGWYPQGNIHGTNLVNRQYSENYLTAGQDHSNKLQQNNAPRIPRAPQKQYQSSNIQLENVEQYRVIQNSEEINFNIDPHIAMMNRQPPHASEFLNFEDEIQTSSPQYQKESQPNAFINYQQENNNLINQSTTAAVAVVEPFEENQRKNSNFHDKRANKMREQQDTMQQQQQYASNSTGTNPSPPPVAGPTPHPNGNFNNFPALQQQSSSINQNSQMNQLNNRNLVNVAAQPPLTNMRTPLSYAQNANNILPTPSAATAATQQPGVYNNPMIMQQMQNGVPAAAGSNGPNGAQTNNNSAAAGVRGDNRFSGGGGRGGAINNQNSLQAVYGQQKPSRGGQQLGNGVNSFQQSFPPPTSITPQSQYIQQQNTMIGSHSSGYNSASNLPLIKVDGAATQNGRIRSLNQRIEYHLEGGKVPNINTSQYKGHQEVQQQQQSQVNNRPQPYMSPTGAQYYQLQPLLRQLPNQNQTVPHGGVLSQGQFQNSSQTQNNSQLGSGSITSGMPIGQNNGGFYYPKKMKQLRRRIPDMQMSGSSDSLPHYQTHINNYQANAANIDPAQMNINQSQDNRGAQINNPL